MGNMHTHASHPDTLPCESWCSPLNLTRPCLCPSFATMASSAATSRYASMAQRKDIHLGKFPTSRQSIERDHIDIAMTLRKGECGQSDQTMPGKDESLHLEWQPLD